MIRKQIYIDDDLDQGLKRMAARTGRPEAEHVRAALAAYLAEAPDEANADDPLLQLVALVEEDEGPTDAAERHDHYLYDASARRT